MSTDPQTPQARFGMIGLAVMGRNLALNIEDHGFSVAVWNREPQRIDEFVSENAGKKFIPTYSLKEFVASLQRPRRMMMLVKAGPPVDSVIEQLKPLMEPGDILIDGGNSYFKDTQRREKYLRDAGLNFMGSGVSGGEEGARYGPSLMPGGSPQGYEHTKPIFEAIAAKTDTGPCVTHCGPDGAGHFVKMVHNGIEYGDMQLIAEAYDVLRTALGLSADELAEVFDQWNNGQLESFLIEITAKIFRYRDPETEKPLIELILDKAEQKGTGKWTAQEALDLAVPIPTIAAAIDARVLSSMKEERLLASKKLRGPRARKIRSERNKFISAVEDALYISKVCSYAQGLSLIKRASDAYSWNVSLSEMARIWTGGCIIRARLLKSIMSAYVKNQDLGNLLLDEEFRRAAKKTQSNWRLVIRTAQSMGIPVPGMSSSLSYYDSYRAANLPQNLTQAQRDFFGAHTYERVDHPELGHVHTDWTPGE